MTIKDEQDELIPVTILTGFLGSGKTTIVNELVHQPALSDTLVIVNEFGEIGLDHLLFTHSEGDLVVEMSSGCICCSIHGDLAKTLREALWRFSQNGHRRFSRVLIETTGLADPVPVVHTLLADPTIASAYRIAGIVTVVDAVNGLGTLDRHEESVRQVAIADLILLSKIDICGASAVSEINAALVRLNPAAEVLPVLAGNIDAHALLAQRFDVDSKGADVREWLNEEDYELIMLPEPTTTVVQLSTLMLQPGLAPAAPRKLPTDANRHGEHIRAFCFVLEDPIAEDDFNAWIEVTVGLFGDRFLRLKGLINISGQATPTVIHGVQHVFHPLIQLPAWPDGSRATRLVFITDNLPKQVIEASIVAFLRPKPGQERLRACDESC